jgi:hypothetical protein
VRKGHTLAQAARFLNGVWGDDCFEAAAELCSGGAIVAFEPNGHAVVALRGSNAAAVEETLDRVLELAGARHGDRRALLAAGRRRGAAECWKLDERFHVARLDSLLVAASSSDLLHAVLDRAADAGAKPASALVAARERLAAADQPLAWGTLDLAALQAQRSDVGRLFARPEGQFLLGPALSLLAHGPRLFFEITLENEDLRLRLLAEGLPEDRARELLPPPGRSLALAALPADPRDVLRGTIYRDLEALFRLRSELFPAEVLPGFSSGLSNAALFFSGDDVCEALFPHLAPEVGLVVRRIEFAPEREPDLPLPSAALVFQLDPAQSERLGEQLTSAFQSIVGLLGIERAQQGHDMLLLELSSVDGVPINSARFPTPPREDGIDLRFNLEPACARVGSWFVVATHRALVAELVPALRGGAGLAASRGAEVLRLEGAGVAEVLRRARKELVMRAVLVEGKAQAQAERELDGLLAVCATVRALNVTSSRPASDQVQLELALDIEPAASAVAPAK